MITHSLPWITIFLSLMMRFANDFHHSSKLLANRLTHDPKIIIQGNSCIILHAIFYSFGFYKNFWFLFTGSSMLFAKLLIFMFLPSRFLSALEGKLHQVFPDGVSLNQSSVSHLVHVHYKDMDYFVEYTPLLVTYIVLFLYIYFSVSKYIESLTQDCDISNALTMKIPHSWGSSASTSLLISTVYPIKYGGGWGCEVSCGGHHRLRGKTTTGSALDGAVFDIAQILAYLVHNVSRSQLYLGFGHFGWLPSFFRSITFWWAYGQIVFPRLKLLSFIWLTYYCSIGLCFSVWV